MYIDRLKDSEKELFFHTKIWRIIEYFLVYLSTLGYITTLLQLF